MLQENKAWTRTDWARVAFLGCLVFLLFFNGGRGTIITGHAWQIDQGCYLQHLGDIIGIDGGNVCQRPKNDHAIGTALLWILPGLLGQAIAHVRHELVTYWILPLIGLSSYVFWVIALYFVLKICRIREEALHLAPDGLPLFALFILFNTYSLHYAISDVFMSHSAEVMVSFAFVYFLLKDKFLFALLSALFLTITRYNDAPVTLLLAGRLLDIRSETSASASGFRLSHRVTLGLGSLGILVLGIWVAFFGKYYDTSLLDLFSNFEWSYFRGFIYSPHWGVLWSGSWWLAALGIGIFLFPKSSNLGRAATIWIGLEALLGILWGGNGSAFGNRYLIGSYSAALLIWLEFLEIPPVRDWKLKVFRSLTWINGTWVVLMTILYGTLAEISPRWENGKVIIPPDHTWATFKNLLNIGAYKTAFYRQILPVNLYYSGHPYNLPADRTILGVVGPAFPLLVFAAVSAGLYLAIYGASLIGLPAYRKASQKAGTENPISE